jgi:hypothetical protein
VAWQDGQQLKSTLSRFQDSKKGKSDVKTVLQAAQKTQARINSLDEGKRKDIEEKDLWLSATKRAEGGKFRDDIVLSKKTSKRIEKTSMTARKSAGRNVRRTRRSGKRRRTRSVSSRRGRLQKRSSKWDWRAHPKWGEAQGQLLFEKVGRLM